MALIQTWCRSAWSGVRWPLLALLLFVSARASAAPIQWSTASGGNGHWYEAVDLSLGWNEARALAESRSHLGMSGHLVTITSAAERNFLIANALPDSLPATLGIHRAWIGAYQDPSTPGFTEPAGGWRWVTGEDWDFESWATGEPNDCCFAGDPPEDFAELHAGGDWNDHEDGFAIPFLVEYAAVPEPGAALLLCLGLVALTAGSRPTGPD